MKKVYQSNNFPYKCLKSFEVEDGRKPKGKRKYYKDFITFDIETSAFEEIKQSCMYIWMIYINGDFIVGRKYSELIYTFEKIAAHINYNLICYVHNLSYEFAFIRELFNWDDVMIVRNHTILKCQTFDKKIEFRCSYLLSNMSLEQFAKRTGAPKKLSGDLFNYEKIRLFNTRLKKHEMMYCLRDVEGLYISIKNYMELEGETFKTLPLTSTGFVRRELKEALNFELGHNYGLKRCLNKEQYILLRRAFRGGNTHANRFFVDETLDNVASYDKKSSYPYQILSKKYPTGFYSALYKYEVEELEKLIEKGLSTVFYFKIENVELKDIYNPCPYIPLSKCIKSKNTVLDNGRIIKCDELTIAITEIDYNIIKRQYRYNTVSIYGMVGKKSKLPKSYYNIVMKYFRKKCDIDKIIDPYGYARSKEKINAIFGVSVTDICRPNIKYIEGEFILTDPDYDEELKKNAKTNPMLYSTGVYCAAYGRAELQELIDIVNDDFRYSDTDSVKFVNEYKYIDDIKKYNDDVKKGMQKIDGIYKNQVMGVYEKEGVYEKFRMLGAKKYAYVENGELHITIAGVNKKKGVNELGSIDNLTPNMKFTESGGVEGRYNDYFGKYKYKGQEIEIRENLYLHKHDYTLGFGKDYGKLINMILSGEYDFLF